MIFTYDFAKIQLFLKTHLNQAKFLVLAALKFPF